MVRPFFERKGGGLGGGGGMGVGEGEERREGGVYIDKQREDSSREGTPRG